MNIYEVHVVKGYNKDLQILNVLAKSAEQAASDATRHCKANYISEPDVVSVIKKLKVHVQYAKPAAKRK